MTLLYLLKIVISIDIEFEPGHLSVSTLTVGLVKVMAHQA